MKKSIVLVFALFVVACSVSKKNRSAKGFANNPVVAHRGAFLLQKYPENSIAALQEAIRLQCTGSEFDVWMTADDSLVIHHDPTYNDLDIEKTNFEALRKFRLSNGEPLPSLHEYLLAGIKRNTATRLVLEIKPSRISKERGLRVAEKTVQLVHQLHSAGMITYISFDYDMLKRIHQLEPGATTQYLNGDKAPSLVKADGISGLDYHYSVFRQHPEWIQEAKQHTLQLNAWTVNDSTDMRWLLDNKFDFITTNQPEILFGLLKNQK